MVADENGDFFRECFCLFQPKHLVFCIDGGFIRHKKNIGDVSQHDGFLFLSSKTNLVSLQQQNEEPHVDYSVLKNEEKKLILFHFNKHLHMTRSFFFDPTFRDLIINGRHYGSKIILSYQPSVYPTTSASSSIPPPIRVQFDFIVLGQMKGPYEHELKTIFNKHYHPFSNEISFPGFKEIYEKVVNETRFLVIAKKPDRVILCWYAIDPNQETDNSTETNSHEA